MKFLGTVLDTASSGSLTDLLKLPEVIKKYIDTVPENVK